MEISEIIGENLRRIRLERNLSLGQLSRQCGVSKVMLSQIEKGAGNPSVGTVWKIADALQVPYTSLLEREIDSGTVISPAEIPAQALDDRGGRVAVGGDPAQAGAGVGEVGLGPVEPPDGSVGARHDAGEREPGRAAGRRCEVIQMRRL